MNFFKEAINAVNDTVQNFDPSAAGKTVVNTVKTIPTVAKERKNKIMTHYEDMKLSNKIRAEREDVEFYDTSSVVWQNTITAMSKTELEELRDKITGLLDI